MGISDWFSIFINSLSRVFIKMNQSGFITSIKTKPKSQYSKFVNKSNLLFQVINNGLQYYCSPKEQFENYVENLYSLALRDLYLVYCLKNIIWLSNIEKDPMDPLPLGLNWLIWHPSSAP